MAKKPNAAVKPLHELAGATGNLQDVSDLQQMLAQTQAELAIARDNIKSLESRLKQKEPDNDTAPPLGAQLDLFEDYAA